MKYAVGDIVFVPFPFSDLASKKVRPALVLSVNPTFQNDVLLCGISSKKDTKAIKITLDDLSKGSLPTTSYVKYWKITTLEKSIILQKIAHLQDNKMKKCILKINELL